MKLPTIMASLLINLILILLAPTRATPTTSYDHYLLSCGAEAGVNNIQGFGGQTWYSDNNSTFSDSFSSTRTAATATGLDAGKIPFATSRVFTTNFTYSFPVSPGPKFIRLFFNHLSPSKDAYLTVQANSEHLLLQNFSASLSGACTSQVKRDHFVEKEFYLHVNNSLLQLTFVPTRPASYAFVNGIEVVSVPENLYVGPNTPKNLAAPGTPFQLSNTTALENAYRLIAGGTDVSPIADSGWMYRRWVSAEPYETGDYGLPPFTGYNNQQRIHYTAQTPNYSAPDQVYQTFTSMGNLSRNIARRVNMTWGFEVDLGFFYLLRLHWCEVVVEVAARDLRVFDVYIQEQMAEEAVDIVAWVDAQYTPIYKDYVVFMDGSGTGNLQLAMHPNTGHNYKYADILLNGLEIFKISNSVDGSLNAPNPSSSCPAPPVSINQTPPPPPKSAFHIVLVIIGSVAGAILLAVLLCCLFIFRRHRKWSKTSAGSSGTTSSKSKGLLSAGKSGTTNRSGGGSSSLPSHLCRHFTLMEIRLATSDFSDSLIVGHGGFGNVYKGTVDTEAGPTPVAIKRLKALSSQGAREFTMEIELLSKLRHVNLVSLIGYCDDAGEMILVYEYMSHGTLRDHLYPHYSDPSTQLSWLGRLEICVGAARGLNYLHTGTDRMVIHRDVKSANILLDERWMAKVSDFGLSKLGPAGADLSHVSTAVKGSFGYVDPEYYRRQQLTEKSDVYSFGVVLFEVLCGRAAVNPNLPKEQVNLRIWARRNQLSGTLDTIVDPTLKGQIAPECLRKFGEVAESCVRDEGAQRPSMADVIGGLQLALRLQMEEETVSSFTGEAAAKDDNTPDEVLDYPMLNSNTSPTTDASVRLIRNSGSGDSTWTSMNNSMSGLFSSTASQDYGGSTPVFSEIFKPEGR